MKVKPRQVALAVVNALAVALAFELAGRVNFFVHHDLSFWTPASHFLYRFYPDLKPVVEDQRAGCLRVLVLGGSTLNPGFCDFGSQFHDRLAALTNREVCEFNTSMPARTSLDAYYQYWFLRDAPFDLVVLYNSINELRANNVPDDVWRADYSHWAWYDEVNFFYQHPWLSRWYFILPFYLKHEAVALDRKVINTPRKVPYNADQTRPEWLRFGATIKTAYTYRANQERTVALARQKREPVLLMTFAYYIPRDYSRERMEKGELDYAKGPTRGEPLEMWGFAANIDKGLRVHNDIIRDLAKTYGTYFVDQQALMGNDPTHFVDACHFSPAGSEAFVRNIIEELHRRHFGGSGVMSS